MADLSASIQIGIDAGDALRDAQRLDNALESLRDRAQSVGRAMRRAFDVGNAWADARSEIANLDTQLKALQNTLNGVERRAEKAADAVASIGGNFQRPIDNLMRFQRALDGIERRAQRTAQVLSTMAANAAQAAAATMASGANQQAQEGGAAAATNTTASANAQNALGVATQNAAGGVTQLTSAIGDLARRANAAARLLGRSASGIPQGGGGGVATGSPSSTGGSVGGGVGRSSPQISTGGVSNALGGIRRSAVELGQAFSRLNQNTGQLEETFENLFLVLGAGLALADVARAGVELHAYGQTLESVTKTTEEANHAWDILATQSDRLGFFVDDLKGNFAQFIASGRTAGMTLNETSAVFFNFAEAMQSTGAPIDKVQSGLEALEDIMTSGSLDESGMAALQKSFPAAIQTMADAVAGGDLGRLRKMIEDGVLGGRDAVLAFVDVAVNKFPLSTEAAKQAKLEFGRFRTAFEEIKQTVANGGFLDSLAQAARDLTSAFRSDEIRTMAATLGQDLAGAVQTMTPYLIAAVKHIDDLALALGGLIVFKLTAWAAGIGKALLGVAAAAASNWPLVLAAGLATLGGTFAYFLVDTGSVQEALARTADVAGTVIQKFDEFTGVSDKIRSVWNSLNEASGGQVESVLSTIEQGFSDSADKAGEWARRVDEALRSSADHSQSEMGRFVQFLSETSVALGISAEKANEWDRRFTQSFSNSADLAGREMGRLRQFLSDADTAFGKSADQAGDWARQLQTSFSDSADLAGREGQRFLQFLSDADAAFGRSAEQAGEWGRRLDESFGSSADSAGEWFRDFSAGLGDAFSKAGEFFGSFGGWIDVVKSAANAVAQFLAPLDNYFNRSVEAARNFFSWMRGEGAGGVAPPGGEGGVQLQSGGGRFGIPQRSGVQQASFITSDVMPTREMSEGEGAVAPKPERVIRNAPQISPRAAGAEGAPQVIPYVVTPGRKPDLPSTLPGKKPTPPPASPGTPRPTSTRAGPRTPGGMQTPRKTPTGPTGGKAADKSADLTNRFNEQLSELQAQARGLQGISAAYDQGAAAAGKFRREQDLLEQVQRLNSQFKPKQVEALRTELEKIQNLEIDIGFKQSLSELDDRTKATKELSAAQAAGGDAVREAQAGIEAYNEAVRLGIADDEARVASLKEKHLALLNLQAVSAVDADLRNMRVASEQTNRMISAMGSGRRGAVREAEIENRSQEMGRQRGVENDPVEMARIRAAQQKAFDDDNMLTLESTKRDNDIETEAIGGQINALRAVGEARAREMAAVEARAELARMDVQLTEEQSAAYVANAEKLASMEWHYGQANDALAQMADSARSGMGVLRDAVASSLTHLEDALVGLVTGTMSAKEAFRNMAASIAADLARLAIRQMIIAPLAGMFGMGMPMMPMGMAATGGIIGPGNIQVERFAAGGKMPVPGFGNVSMKPTGVGGIARQPTAALFGEGDSDEAYIPLKGDQVPLRRLPNGDFVAELPGGRSIPAELQKFAQGGTMETLPSANVPSMSGNSMAAIPPGEGGDTTNIAPNITVNVQMPQGGGSQEEGQRFGQAISRQIESRVIEIMRSQTRNGGILNPNGGY